MRGIILNSVVKVFVVLFALFISNIGAQEATEKTLLLKLAEAQDYLSYSPEIASNILKTHLPYIDTLPNDKQLSWHQNLLRASISLTDLVQLELSVKAMLNNPELNNHPNIYATVLSSTGIFMRKLGHLDESIVLFNCGLSLNRLLARQKLSLLISKGHSLRQLGKIEEAKSLYLEALDIANQVDNQVIRSVIFNALANTAFERQDFKMARYYYLNALHLSQKIARLSGQMFSGLYLMTIALIENDFTLYNRLYSPTNLLVEKTENQDRKAHFYWLEMAFKVKNNGRLSIEEKSLLKQHLYNIKEMKLHNVLVSHFGKLLNVDSEIKLKKSSEYKGSLMTQFASCLISP